MHCMKVFSKRDLRETHIYVCKLDLIWQRHWLTVMISDVPLGHGIHCLCSGGQLDRHRGAARRCCSMPYQVSRKRQMRLTGVLSGLPIASTEPLFIITRVKSPTNLGKSCYDTDHKCPSFDRTASKSVEYCVLAFAPSYCVLDVDNKILACRGGFYIGSFNALVLVFAPLLPKLWSNFMTKCFVNLLTEFRTVISSQNTDKYVVKIRENIFAIT